VPTCKWFRGDATPHLLDLMFNNSENKNILSAIIVDEVDMHGSIKYVCEK